MTTPSRMARAWAVLRTGVDPERPPSGRVVEVREPDPAPACFHWQDANEDEPPIGVPVVGMWIDSDGTTSTLPVVYGFSGDGHWMGWTYDDQLVREPHAWCANLDAHQG